MPDRTIADLYEHAADIEEQLTDLDAISEPDEKISASVSHPDLHNKIEVPLADQTAYKQAKKRLAEIQRELNPPRPVGRQLGSKSKNKNHFRQPPVRLAKGQRTPKGFQRDPQRGLVPIAMQKDGKLAQPDVPFDRLFEQIGAKQSLEPLQDALARSKNGNAAKFLDMLSTPAAGHWRLSTIAKKCGLTLHDMGEIWRDAQLQRATMEIVNGTPQIAADMVEDARSIYVCCPRCDGLKRIMGLKGRYLDCPNCGAEGVIRKPGDQDSRKHIFETVGFTGKSKGVNINNFLGPVSVERELDALDSLMDDKTVIDVGVSDVGAG